MTDLKEVVEAKLKDKSESFVGALLLWGSVVSSNHSSEGGTLWSLLHEQLKYQAEKHHMAVEEVVNWVFGTNDPDVFLGRLQV